MTDSLLQLDYAPRSRSRRRRRLILLSLVLLALAGGGVAARTWSRPVFDRIIYLRQQRDCMNYAAPPDQVVFTSRCDEAKALRQRPGYRGVYIPNHTFGCDAGFEPVELTLLTGPLTMTRGPPHGVAFMHRRRSPNGEERFVLIDVHVTGGGRVYGFWKAAPKPVAAMSSERIRFNAVGEEFFRDTRDFRVFSGQPDPADESRFVLRYEIDGVAGTIAGRLEDSGRTRLAVLDGLPRDITSPTR